MQHFHGLHIQFGCLVYHTPSPTRDNRAKAEPTMRNGIVMDYRLAFGGVWSGDIVVTDPEDFLDLPAKSDSGPGNSKGCRTHITRTVK